MMDVWKRQCSPSFFSSLLRVWFIIIERLFPNMTLRECTSSPSSLEEDLSVYLLTFLLFRIASVCLLFWMDLVEWGQKISFFLRCTVVPLEPINVPHPMHALWMCTANGAQNAYNWVKEQTGF